VTTLAARRLHLGLLAVIALALSGAILVAQYVRSSWPFGRPSADDAHAAMPDMQDMPAEAGTQADHAGHAPAASSAPAGYAPISVDAARAAAMQLSAAPVELREFTRTLRSVGVITLDETRSAHVHAKVRGWIDEIYVNFVGRKVKAGEPLCSIYSQDVYAAEIEFLSILERSAGRAESDPLLDAARRRLALWDVPADEIARLEQTRQARRTFPLLAPRAGVVVAKQAIQGVYVDPSLELYTLSDLASVWVLVDVYESDVPYVHLGDRARLTIEGQPGALEARVSFMAPTIDEATRTRKVRLELDNKRGDLLPGAFASAELELRLGMGLALPESAVIRTGARSIVFVAHGAHAAATDEHAVHLEPREVTLGPLVGDQYRVESGVAAGESVATGAQFLLDSESRLRATSTPGGAHVHH
jgi:membrane fusion protein, copper/silver efflux system